MILFENVTKKFGEVVALSEVSFEVDKGEFVFLTGPSGAGKTTIIKLILREFFPTEGKIEIMGEDISLIRSKKIPQFRRKVGVVFQDFKLLIDRTVLENVILPLQIRKVQSSQIAKQAQEVLKLVGLWERKDLFPAQLAVGEIQRASLARAIIGKPEILLADEPTGNLDPNNSQQIIELLKKINDNETTVLMATHNASLVNLLKERVICLAEGKLISDEKKGKYKLPKFKFEQDV